MFSPEHTLALYSSQPNSFEVVISDHLMMGMNGLDLIARIKSLRPEIPCIISTGLRSVITPQQQQERGIAGVLYKPVGMMELGMLLRRVLVL